MTQALPAESQLQDRVVRRVVFDADAIAERVRELGAQVTRAYPDGDLVVLASLRGSLMFACDIVRAIQRPLHFDFMTSSAPGFGLGGGMPVQFLYDPENTIRGKHVLLLEDVVETGSTVSRLMTALGARSPRSLEVCALLRKRSVTGRSWPVRFAGFDAPSEFLVGYGLDHADHFRHLPYIVSLE